MIVKCIIAVMQSYRHKKKDDNRRRREDGWQIKKMW